MMLFKDGKVVATKNGVMPKNRLAEWVDSVLRPANAMNKNDLIARVVEVANLSLLDAAAAVDAVFDTITEALANGGEIRLVGFGTFSVANRAASIGRNPTTGEKIYIAASLQPKFRAGKALKRAVNKPESASQP